MLIGLWIRDVVLIEALDLSIGPGLTVLTGETGAGKSIILDALGLAVGARAEAGLVRRGAAQAAASAVFAPSPTHPVWALLEVHGQHETVGLLDARTHRPLLDAFAGLQGEGRAVAERWRGWREAREA